MADCVSFSMMGDCRGNCSIRGGAELGLSKERGRLARISRRSFHGAAKMAALQMQTFPGRSKANWSEVDTPVTLIWSGMGRHSIVKEAGLWGE